MFRNTGYVLLDQRRVQSQTTRIFLLEDAFAEADPAIAESLRTLLEFMADDLPVVEHAKLAPEGFDPWREAMRVVQGYEVWQSFADFVRRHNPKFGPGVRERMEFAASVTPEQFEAASAVERKSWTMYTASSRQARCWFSPPRLRSRRASIQPRRNLTRFAPG